MKTTIVIDDADRTECPDLPWIAHLYDEDGEMLAESGIGSTRHLAVLDLLKITETQFPEFAQ